jgi:hypothetical protein
MLKLIQAGFFYGLIDQDPELVLQIAAAIRDR